MWFLSSRSEPAALSSVPVRSLTAASVVEGAGLVPGRRVKILDAAFVEGAGFVALVEQGGQRFLGSSAESSSPRATPVCETAQAVTGHAGTIALSCADADMGWRRVEILDAATLKRRRVVKLKLKAGESGPPLQMSWPALDASLRFAAVAPGPGQVEVFDLESGELLRSLRPQVVGSHVESMAFSPDGAKLAVAHNNGQIEVFSLEGATPASALLAPSVEDKAPQVAFTADGTRVVSASFWGQFRLWGLDGALLFEDRGDPQKYGNHGLALSESGEVYQIRAGQLLARDSSGGVVGAAPADWASKFGGPPAGLTQGVRHVDCDAGQLLVVDARGKAATLLNLK